jgi:hypothetical protein
MGTIAKFLFALKDTHNMGISPSGSAGKEALSRSLDYLTYRNTRGREKHLMNSRCG